MAHTEWYWVEYPNKKLQDELAVFKVHCHLLVVSLRMPAERPPAFKGIHPQNESYHLIARSEPELESRVVRRRMPQLKPWLARLIFPVICNATVVWAELLARPAFGCWIIAFEANVKIHQ